MPLSQLTIKNIVLIESLSIDFQDGLGTLTGETGAGKSILLDSLGLALGARSESRLVRSGADKASVTAEFTPPPSHPIWNVIQDLDLDLDIETAEPLILRRSLNADGRSRAFINDQAISAKALQIIGQNLVEIHGQYDTHGLLDSATHGPILDHYAGLDAPLKTEWQAYHTARKKLQAMEADILKSQQEEEFLRDAIKSLDTLSPQQGEEDELRTLKDQLMHRERVMEGLNTAYAALTQSDHDPIAAAQGALDRISDKIGDQGNQLIESLDRARYEIEDVCSQIQSLSADLSESEHNLETIDERLYALRKEARRHNCTVDDLPDIRNQLAKQLDTIEHAEDLLNEQIHITHKAKIAFETRAKSVSEQRKQAAEDLDTQVAAELAPLKLGKAKFITRITQKDENDWNENGMDTIAFLVSTNPGQEPGPLGKIASGGEMARFMLALKVVIAQNDSAKTMVFDEVDAGIGGGTADAVGQRLARLAQNNQVLVVTHAPQVAARASHHYVVAKSGDDTQTRTDIAQLTTPQQREEEIARMLSGETITPEALAAARTLINPDHQNAA